MGLLFKVSTFASLQILFFVWEIMSPGRRGHLVQPARASDRVRQPIHERTRPCCRRRGTYPAQAAALVQLHVLDPGQQPARWQACGCVAVRFVNAVTDRLHAVLAAAAQRMHPRVAAHVTTLDSNAQALRNSLTHQPTFKCTILMPWRRPSLPCPRPRCPPPRCT